MNTNIFTNNATLPLTVLAAMTLCACAPPRTAGPPQMALKVTVAQPHAGTVTNWDEYPGHLAAVETVEVRPRVPGYIDSIHFGDGAEIKAGDLLFVIDPRPYQAEFDRAKAQREQAEIRLELTKRELNRTETLRGTKAISEEEYDSRRMAMRGAEAALIAAQAAEISARVNLDYTQIRAPISGRIGRRLVTPGNLVQPGSDAVLATLVSLDPVYCYFDVDERAFLGYREMGTLGENPAKLSCELGLDSEQGFPHAGVVDFFDNQVERRMGTIRLRAVFNNGKRDLVPGLFARVRVPAGAPEQALLIPDVAVATDQNTRFVFVINKESVAEVRPVQLGRKHGTEWAVLKGLTPEDRVVVNGLLMLRPGMKVDATSGTEHAATPVATAQAAR